MAPRTCTPDEAADTDRHDRHRRLRPRPGQPRRLPDRARRPGRLGRPHLRRRPAARLLPGAGPPQRLLPVRLLRAGRADAAGRRGQHRAGARRIPPVRPHPAALQPPGDDGAGRPAGRTATVNLSLHIGATYDELLLAGQDPDRLLVVEVNPNLPRTRSLGPDYTNTIPLDAGRRPGRGGRRAVHPAPAAARRDRRGHRRAGPLLRHRRRHPADRHRRRAEHGGHQARRGPGRRLRHPLRDVHRRAHAPPPGRQGHQRRQERCSTGSPSPPSPSGRPSSTPGSTATRTWPSCRSRWSTTRRSSPRTTPSSPSTGRSASTSTARWWPTTSTGARSRGWVATRTSWPVPRCASTTTR